MPAPISQTPGQIVKKGTTQQVAAYDPTLNPNLMEGIPDSNVYMHSPAFQDILKRASTGGLDSLSVGERTQLQEAIKLYPQLQQVVGQPQEKSQSQVASDEFWKDMKGLGKSLVDKGNYVNVGGMTMNPTAGIYVAEIGNDILNWASSFGQDVSPLSMAARAMGSQGTASDAVKETLDNLGLEPIKEGATYKVVNPADPYGPMKEIPYSYNERLVNNTLIGALRLVPEMATQLVDNPVGFITGIVQMPVQALSILHDVVTGEHLDIQDGQVVGRKLSEKEIGDAREQITQNPLMLPMAAMVVYGGVKGSAKWITRERGYVDGLEKKAVELEEMKAAETAKVNDSKAKTELPAMAPTEGAMLEAADKYGLESPGLQLKKDGTPAFYTFRDPQNDGNFSVKSLDEIPQALEKHRASFGGPKPSIYDGINLDAVPEDMKVNVEVIRGATGERVKVEQSAREAYDETTKSIDRYKALLDCLKA